MGKIGIEFLVPGMKLKSDVKDINGRLLLPSGKDISEKHLTVFRAWGITEVDVHGAGPDEDEPAPNEEINPLLIRRAEEELGIAFRHTDTGNHAVREIFRLSVVRRARMLAKGIARG